jgi:antitoxin component HigA of HigAB toxin-antitoxin module
MFDYKFRRGAQSVNGTRLFLMPSIIVEFERMYNSFLEKKGSENKFEKLISWCKKEAPEIFQAHQLEREEDLKMIRNYAEMYSLNSESLERRVLTKASEVGLI